MRELLRVLDDRRQPGHRIRQTVVFTRFFDTLQDLVARLRQVDPGMLVGTYSGSGGQYTDPRGTERDEIQHRFLRGEIDVLICTDAAAEGLNLQTADLLINYDLPWNPMKVEQRIGRIDRIGQKYDEVYVLNLCYTDSAEQIVYERLLNRLAQAGHVVGTQQVSMLPVTREEFNDLAAGDLTPGDLEARALERLAAQKRRSQSMEIPAKDLYEIYLRLKERYAVQRLPITLDGIWDVLAEAKYLRDLGCTVAVEPHRRMTLRGWENVVDGKLLTVDRNLFEYGTREGEGTLHFGSYGDDVFDQILWMYEAHDLPGCVVRLSETVPDTDCEVVAYAAVCMSGIDHRNGQEAFVQRHRPVYERTAPFLNLWQSERVPPIRHAWNLWTMNPWPRTWRTCSGTRCSSCSKPREKSTLPPSKTCSDGITAVSTFIRQKVYQTDPLLCPKSRGTMKIVAFIEDEPIGIKILEHLGLWDTRNHVPQLPETMHIQPIADSEVIYDYTCSQLPSADYQLQ